jgi:hypothetical protein
MRVLAVVVAQKLAPEPVDLGDPGVEPFRPMSKVKSPRLIERIRPPAAWFFSTTSGTMPPSASLWAVARPEGPAPTIKVWIRPSTSLVTWASASD